jgi:hypothetical protein
VIYQYFRSITKVLCLSNMPGDKIIVYYEQNCVFYHQYLGYSIVINIIFITINLAIIVFNIHNFGMYHFYIYIFLRHLN